MKPHAWPWSREAELVMAGMAQHQRVWQRTAADLRGRAELAGHQAQVAGQARAGADVRQAGRGHDPHLLQVQEGCAAGLESRPQLRQGRRWGRLPWRDHLRIGTTGSNVSGRSAPQIFAAK